MLVNSNSINLGLCASVVEPTNNHEASNYIINHYDELILSIRKLEIKEEKAHDLLHDVYISIDESERNGEGFDMEYGTRVDSEGNMDVDIMDVGQFVHGRIRLYAKNTKYRTDVCEANAGTIYETIVYDVTELDENGQEILGKDGMPKTVKKVERHKKAVMLTASAATFNNGGDITENNDEFQKAFAMASIADSTDDITELMSLREQIDYCIDVCDLNGVKLINFFKNLDTLADMLGDYSRKKKTAESVFGKLSELVEYHTDFAESLMSILKYSAKNRAAFEAVIATY